MRCVRLNFSKSGRAVYISHLDINRMMIRALRRANLPIWYTEGFNPHPYIAFALPLSLGQSSDCEYMDIRVEGDISDDEIVSKLNSVLPEGVKIIGASEPVFDPKEIAKAQYFIKLIFSSEAATQNFSQKAEELMNSSEILAEKRGKKGHRKIMKQINLIDYIYDAKISTVSDVVNIQCVLSAGSVNNLNPALLIETLEKLTESEHDMMYIARKKLITASNQAFK
ncbi:MAG: TIGR03936 family radical SAM-associated protein [Clostridia bacterium]|nr:TIGR03936 family radical SAM-associated protein [Clostridia bacterium]